MSALFKPDGNLTPPEVKLLLSQFSSADWSRATSIARLLCGGLTGWSPDDLLQETITRFLEGKRVWHSSIHPLVVLKSAMHSVASNARKRIRQGPINETLSVDASDIHDRDDEQSATVTGATVVAPEQLAYSNECLAAIQNAVSGNEELELLVMAWADGLRGEAASQELGWDMKTYEAARKRLTRRLGSLATERRNT